jgi:membrane protein implicated in regulation of membrane protease activity
MNQTTTPKEKPETVVTTDTPAGTWTLTGYGIFALILAGLSLAFGIAFQIGAGMLSYAKYQSIGWAILDTIFAVFYYPYYAIFLNRSDIQSPTSEGLMGGARVLRKGPVRSRVTYKAPVRTSFLR